MAFLFTLLLLNQKKSTTFAVDSANPKGWVGQDIMDFVLQNAIFCKFVSAKVSLRSRKRTFSERYLRLVKLRNFDLPEDTATKRPCQVYYTYMRKCVREDTAHMSLYNTRLAWAG